LILSDALIMLSSVLLLLYILSYYMYKIIYIII